MLNDEAVYNLDLDDDGNIGDTVSAIYMNVPDADAAVENPKDNFGVYKTATGSYIADTADLAVGAYADDPTLLVKQTVSRSKTQPPLITLNIPQLVRWLTLRVAVVCTIRIQKESGLEITLLMLVCSSKPIP